MKKPLVILGGGESGCGAARLALCLGWSPWITDAGAIRPDRREQLESWGVPWEDGGHDVERVLALAREGGLVVNTGEMLNVLTRRRVHAVVHRVKLLRGGSRPRLSIPYFYNPVSHH